MSIFSPLQTQPLLTELLHQPKIDSLFEWAFLYLLQNFALSQQILFSVKLHSKSNVTQHQKNMWCCRQGEERRRRSTISYICKDSCCIWGSLKVHSFICPSCKLVCLNHVDRMLLLKNHVQQRTHPSWIIYLTPYPANVENMVSF